MLTLLSLLAFLVLEPEARFADSNAFLEVDGPLSKCASSESSNGIRLSLLLDCDSVSLVSPNNNNKIVHNDLYFFYELKYQQNILYLFRQFRQCPLQPRKLHF